MNREQRVEKFNKLMSQQIGTNPQSVPLNLRQLGINLIFEELAETASASGAEETFLKLCLNFIDKKLPGFKKMSMKQETDKLSIENVFNIELLSNKIQDSVSGDGVDPVLQLDGLCDVQYTLSWAINVYGQKAHFEPAFIETCRSNDSKACTSIEEAEQTKAHWEAKDGDQRYVEPNNVDGVTYYIVKRKSDGKVTKSINYSPANFEQFFAPIVPVVTKKCDPYCTYSKSMDQPYPRLCVYCKTPEKN